MSQNRDFGSARLGAGVTFWQSVLGGRDGGRERLGDEEMMCGGIYY